MSLVIKFPGFFGLRRSLILLSLMTLLTILFSHLVHPDVNLFSLSKVTAPENSLLFSSAHGRRDDSYSCSSSNPCSNGACCGASGYCGYGRICVLNHCSRTMILICLIGPTYCGTGCLSNCNATAECGQYASTVNKTCPLNTWCLYSIRLLHMIILTISQLLGVRILWHNKGLLLRRVPE